MTRNGFVKKFLVLSLGLLSCVVLAQGANPIDRGRAADIAQKKFGGQLFGKIKKIDMPDGSVVYEIRLDDNGRMTIVHVDGQGNVKEKN
jgi:uncharacterized membrane protein YkoI